MSFSEMKTAAKELSKGANNEAGEDHSNIDVIEALAEEDEES